MHAARLGGGCGPFRTIATSTRRRCLPTRAGRPDVDRARGRGHRVPDRLAVRERCRALRRPPWGGEIALQPTPLNPDSGLWFAEAGDVDPTGWMSDEVVDGTDRARDAVVEHQAVDRGGHRQHRED